jgi:hypothetical protein
MSRAEEISRAFHETYERLAPEHGYETRKASAVPWEDVPEQNKSLMIDVVRSLLADGIIIALPAPQVTVNVTGSAVANRELSDVVQREVKRLRGF